VSAHDQSVRGRLPQGTLWLQCWIGRLCWYSGLIALARAVQRRRATARILAYHHILPAARGGSPPHLPWTMYTEADAFARQMRYIARHYRPVALPDLVDALTRGAALRPGSVALTLDDGYHDQIDTALPVLRAQGVPATLAIVAGTLGATAAAEMAAASARGRGDTAGGEREGLPAEWAGARFATADQLRIARAGGVRLAGHSVTHRDLTACPPGALRAELAGAREAVRALGDAGDLFCYPGGMHNATVRAAVRAAGYRAALTGEPGANSVCTDPLALRRVLVGASPDHFVAAQLAGLLDGPAWLYHRANRARLWWARPVRRPHPGRGRRTGRAGRARRAGDDAGGAAGPCRCPAPPPAILPALPRDEWPHVTIAVPTYNEGATIDHCLRSIAAQDYPRDRLDVLVVDGGSADDTVARARRYPGVRVLGNPARDAETAKEIGLRAAAGDLFMYLDADAALTGPGWLRALVGPLRDDPTLSASFTRFVAWPGAAALERYLNYHPLQLGPLLRALCVDLAATVHERRATHTVCCFGGGRVPPVGLCLYRLTALRAVVAHLPAFRWVDVALPALLAQAGHGHVAYVPGAGIYHGRPVTLRTRLRQQRRDVVTTYLPWLDTREFRYVEFSSAREVWRLLGWVLQVHTVVPLLLTALREGWRRQDMACLYGVPLAVLETDMVAWHFLRHPRGRVLLRQGLGTLLGAALNQRGS
jgi:peptidoglycan/xylan/chitin deacetylase (PgdA/CDA1 family)